MAKNKLKNITKTQLLILQKFFYLPVSNRFDYIYTLNGINKAQQNGILPNNEDIIKYFKTKENMILILKENYNVKEEIVNKIVIENEIK